ncbi:hypothetical protein GCM10011428_34230 [Streptomyces violaceus]
MCPSSLSERGTSPKSADPVRGEQTARPVRGSFPPGVAPTALPATGAAVHIGQARPAAAGDHCSRSGTDTYDGSFAGEEKVSCAPDGLCSM